MNKFNRHVLASALLVFSTYASADGSVVLNTQQRIDNLSTLSQLVTHPALSEDVWWPGAIIATKQGTQKAQQDKQNVLARLAACQVDASAKKQAMLQSVIDQLKNIHVVGRVLAPLDPDLVRVKPGLDVPLQGEYQLYTPSRPSTVLVMGAISKPGPVAWRPATRVSHYLDNQELLSGADNSTATLIQLDGKTTTVPVAYWNDLHREAEPGSVLWVGFAPCADNDAGKPLQDDIISLLTRRVPD